LNLDDANLTGAIYILSETQNVKGVPLFTSLFSGAEGAADIVPPNADLIYDIELIEVR
jgi:hypothetical protein